jgi:hypothetical protein
MGEKKTKTQELLEKLMANTRTILITIHHLRTDPVQALFITDLEHF